MRYFYCVIFMRIRRKPWARPELEACDFFINNPVEFVGSWHDRFLKKQPIVLEKELLSQKYPRKILTLILLQ